MSLQELSGPSIHLKLSIKEGHGFGFLKDPVVIVAGTNGIFLETEVVPPSPDPLFHIDLVWETDKRNLRRFRASNTPMKLECFTVGSNNRRDCIGSILLNLKSAQVLPKGSQNNVNEKWYKLVGVPAEAKALQPELLLSLTIQEPNILSQPLSSSAWEGRSIPPTMVASAKQTEETGSRHIKKSQVITSTSIPAPEYKQGFIQLGTEGSAVDTLLLNFTVKRALELELLLGGHEGLIDVNSGLKPFQISFTLMGHSLRTKQFGDKSPGAVCVINEEVTLPLRTSLSVLHQYLQENPCATVGLLYFGQEVAAAELHIRSLVPTNDKQCFSHEFDGKTVVSQKCKLVSSRCGSIPVHDSLQPTIEIISKLHLAVPQTTPNQAQLVTNQTELIPDSSSCQTKEDCSSRSESRQSQDTFIVTAQSGPVWVPVAPGEKLSALQNEATLSLDIASKKDQASKPQGDSGSGDEIQCLQHHSSFTLKSPETDSVPTHNRPEIKPAVSFETNTVYQIVEELEDWKEKQQEIFLAELKQKEIEHLARVTEEWTNHVKAQNTELKNEVEECKAMANTLSKAKQDLKDRLKTCSTREQELRKAKDGLQMQYQLKFQELTLAAQRLDEGVKLKVASVESKCSKLEERLKEVESENEKLRHQLNQKVSAPSPHSNAPTCGLSHNQVSQLITQVDQLEGKLHESLQSKAYFKEQWGRAVREMNQAKLRYSQSSDSSKRLEHLLTKEETELQRDQRTLENLRQELSYLNSH